MAIQELFDTSLMICCSCGKCCSADTLCDKCEAATLAANGLSQTLVSEIHGLKYKARYYGNGFEYSELWDKIKDIKTKQLTL